MGKRNRESVDIVRNASDKDLIDAQKNCPRRSDEGCRGCPIKGGKCIVLESEIIRRFEKLVNEKESGC